MSKFNFKFQQLLNIKIQYEKSIKNELAKEMENLRREQGNLNDLLQTRSDSMEEFSNKKNIDVLQINSYYAFIDNISQKIRLKNEDIYKLEKKINEIRNRLIKITSEKEILVKLREKDLERYRQNILLEEQKVTDEIVSFMYFNR